MLEAADDLGLQKTSEYLDLATEFAFSEVQCRQLSKNALTQVLRSTLENVAMSGGSVTEEPMFKSYRCSSHVGQKTRLDTRLRNNTLVSEAIEND